jgi:hypothetical protein
MAAHSSSSSVRAAAFLKMAFILNERLFDRIEIGTVRRQVNKRGANTLDGFANPCNLVGWEIIEVS